MPAAVLIALLSLTIPTGTPLTGKLTAARQDNIISVAGDHFRLKIDETHGGEITSIELFDGADWNSVLGGDGQTCPAACFGGGDDEFKAAGDRHAKVERFLPGDDRVQLDVVARPCDAAGKESPWTVRLGYDIYPEGAVFVDMEWSLPPGADGQTRATVSFDVDQALTKSAKYRQSAMGVFEDPLGFESARVAFGVNPQLSYTNDIQAMLEDKRPIAGAAGFEAEPGRFTWRLADGKSEIQSPAKYRNRFCLGLGSGAIGFRRSNLVGQRIYHWINFLNPDARAAWYPTDEQIDKMAAHHGSVLILHEHWMLHGGDLGWPHPNYGEARDQAAMHRTIEHAHARGMRVGLCMRGTERYCLESGFFDRYCRRDWDGFYVDWHGPQCVACHEHQASVDTAVGDVHFSTDGSRLPAKDYFLFERRLREIVGPHGLLIGHQGVGAAGVLANLVFDAYLPGEAQFDHGMFTDLDQAVYGGMMGAGVCNPWTLNAQSFVTPEAVAKMAVWGFYPHVGLGMQRPGGDLIFSTDPDDKTTEFAAAYWRILAALNMTNAQAFNLPNQRPEAAACADRDFRTLIYKDKAGNFLVIAANLGAAARQTTISLRPGVLGMTGRYSLQRVDAKTGAITPLGQAATNIETSRLGQWEFEGYRLLREPPVPATATQTGP